MIWRWSALQTMRITTKKKNAPRAGTRGSMLLSRKRRSSYTRYFSIFSPASCFALEPARHPATARPGLARLGVAILRFHLALGAPSSAIAPLALPFVAPWRYEGDLAFSERRNRAPRVASRAPLSWPSENAHAGPASDPTHPSAGRTIDCRTTR